MKRIILSFCCLLAAQWMIAQTPQIREIMFRGTELHDLGKYKEALAEYKKALALDPNSSLVNYEISFTLLAMKKYDEAIEYADKVLKLKQGDEVEALIVKGSAQDDSGKPKEAIKTYEYGLKKFEPHHLIYFNLALTQYRMGNRKEAEENLENAIQTNPGHSSSHYMLGMIMAESQQKSKAILALNMFLLIEDNTQRSEVALAMINKMMGLGVEAGDEKTVIYLNKEAMDDDFGPADLFLSLNHALRNTDEFKDMPKDDFFAQSLVKFHSLTSELYKEQKGFYWKMYVGFFSLMHKEEILEPMAYYVQKIKKSVEVDTYIATHPEEMKKLNAFFSGE